MCSCSRKCAMLMACFYSMDILLCGLSKEECPYLKPKEPDEPLKEIIEPYHLNDDFAVAGTSSATFIQSGIGTKIGQLKDGRELFYFKPKDLEIINGEFIIVDKNGSKNTINFEKNKIL